MSIETTSSKVTQTRFKVKQHESHFENPFDANIEESTLYIGAHNDGNVIYDFEVGVNKDVHGYTSSINIGKPIKDSEVESLAKLSQWLKKAAECIDNHLESIE